MKKLLLASALVSSISLTSFASDSNSFYFGLDAGASFVSAPKSEFLSTLTTNPNQKLKSKISGNAGLFVGYNIDEAFRVDLKYSHYFNTTPKFTDTVANLDTEKRKFQLSSLTLNAYYNLADLDFAKFYFGAGVGFSRIGDKLHYTDPTAATQNYIFNFKNKTNFAYRLTVGSSFEVAENVNLDLSYSFSNLGKTRSKDDSTLTVYKTNNLNIHSVNLGVRIQL